MLTSSLALALPDRPRVSPFADAPDGQSNGVISRRRSIESGSSSRRSSLGRLTAIYYELVVMMVALMIMLIATLQGPIALATSRR